MNVARAVARVESVNFAGFCSGFYWLESGEKYIDNICPRECPSGSEGQTCGENLPEFVPVFVGLKVEKKIY